jgi:hypothetical protein
MHTRYISFSLRSLRCVEKLLTFCVNIGAEDVARLCLPEGDHVAAVTQPDSVLAEQAHRFVGQSPFL